MPVFSTEQAKIAAQIAAVRVTKPSAVERAARTVLRGRNRYENLAGQTGVPWELIGAIHYRESNCSFSAHLHNGNPLTARTRDVPKGRPLHGSPPFTWEESALDALELEGLPKVSEWSDERICFEAEKYNGFGYRRADVRIPSPYVWSGTSLYKIGKFYSDGKYDPGMVDVQMGVWPVILRIREIVAEEEAHSDAMNTLDDSTKWVMAGRVKQGVKGLWASLAAAFTYDNVMFGLKVVLALGLAGLIVYLLMGWFQKQMVKDVKEGRFAPSRQTAGKATLEEEEKPDAGPAQ
jgi:lysozyme family protein